MENNKEIAFLKARVRELEKAAVSLESRCETLQRQSLDIPVAYQSFDTSGCLLEVNQAWLDILGYSKDEIIGRSFADFLPPAQREHFAAHFPRLKAPGEVIGNEVEIVKKDGKRIFAAFFGRVERDNNGNFTRSHCVFVDISKQKLIEERGEAECQLLHICQMAKNVNQLMSQLVDFFTTLTGCEAVGVRLSQGEDFPYYTTKGFPASFVNAENSLCIRSGNGKLVRDSKGNPVLECMCGNVLRERFDPTLPFFTPTGSFWTNSTSSLLSTTSETDRQARTRNRCNGERYETVALIPLRNQKTTFGLIQFNDRRKGHLSKARIEQLEHLVAYVALTLAKHLADEQLRESEEKYRLVVENAQEGIIIVQNDRMIFLNASAIKLVGFNIERMLAEPFINFVHPSDRQSVLDHHANCLRGCSGNSPHYFRVIRQDGVVRWLSAQGTTVAWNGKTASLIFITDKTEHRNAEIDRQKNEQNLNAILNATQESIQLFDLEGNIILTNEAAVRRLGRTVKDSIGRNVFDMFPPEIADKRRKSCQQVALSGQPLTLHDNREGMHLEAHLWPVKNQRGKVDRIALFARDITERILAEKKATESHELLHSLARQVPGVIYQYRLYPDGRSSFPYASPGMFNIYEVTPEEVEEDATPVFGRLHHEDRERVTEDILRSARTLTTFYCEFRVVLPQQGLRWRWSQAQPQKLDDGSVLWHGIISDITERKEFEEALKISEEDLRESQKIAHIGSWRLDVATNKVVWSDELYRMYGFDPVNPPPPYSEHQKLFTQESWEKLSAALQNTVATGAPYTLELETVRKDGPNGWMWVHGMAVLDKLGKTTSIRGVAQDISARRSAEKERDNLNTQLVQAQKMESVGRLAGGVAHDYNNMLGVIIGYSEMALEKINSNEPLYSDLHQILSAANRSADVTRQLLAFSRQQAISPRRLDLNTTIEGLLKMIRRLIGEDIDLLWKPKVNILPIKMDPSQLDQILVNLCVNARDAILDVGAITIETGMKTFDKAYCDNHSGYLPGNYVALIVSDNGCGMTKDIQSKLFEPFFTTKEMGKGTGLGLATVYGIVKQNSGFIDVYSERERGSSFKLYFPCVDQAESVLPSSAAPIPDALGNETILLVEDEESILTMTAAMIRRLGYKVIATEKPDQAIKMARQHSSEIHLLVTDVIMPEMNGRQLSKTIQLCYPDIKVLFMSGYTADVIAHHGVLDQGINFIQKPFTRRELSVKLREVLDG